MPQVSILLIVSGLVALLIVWIIRQKLSQRGVRSLFFMQIAVAWWCFGSGLENLAQDPQTATLWAILEYPAILSLPVFWFFFALEYSQQRKYLARIWRYLIWVMPALAMLVIATNSYHNLFWSRIAIEASEPYARIVFEHGPLFWLFSAYSYVLMALGMLIMLIAGFSYPNLFRRQMVIILAAAFIPWLSNLLYLIDRTPLPGVDITPLSFVVSGALIVFGIYRAGLLNLAPIAQDALFESISDGVIVLDAQAHLVILNPTAKKLLGLSESSLIGKPAAQFFPQWPFIAQRLEVEKEFQQELFVAATEIYIDLRGSPLYAVNHRPVGWVLVLRDITMQLKMEADLKSQAEQLTHVVNHVPAVLMYISVEERLIFYNRAFLTWLGQTNEDLTGRLIQDILPEIVYQRMSHFYQRALSGERVSADTLIEDQNGNPRYLHIDLVPHQDELGRTRAVLALGEDITERHQIEQNERQQRGWAEALRQTVAALNSTLDYDEVLDIILDRIAIVLPHDAANIALIDDHGGIKIRRSRGYGQFLPDEPDPFSPLTLSSFPNWQKMSAAASPLAIPDTHKDPDWHPIPQLSWVRSYAGVPISIGDRVIGFLSLDSATPDFFNYTHAEHLMSFANEAAVAIEKARLYADVRRRAEEMASLNRIANAITAGLDLERVMAAILEQCQQVLPLDVFYIGLYDDETDLVELPLFFDLGQIRSMPARRVTDNPGLTGYIIQNRTVLHIPDVLDPDYKSPVPIIHLGGVSSRCYLGVPLILRDRVIGVISIQTYYPNAYTQEQIRLLEIIATQAAIALENARLYAQAQHMAITDSLTGLYNRRYLLEQAVQMMDEANQSGALLSIILLDGDHFKHINDTYGHLAGDQALLVLAQMCSQKLRPQDIVGRYGGEEFGILLPGLDAAAAVEVAEQIRLALTTQVLSSGSQPFTISASFGVAQFIHRESLEQALSRADAALYRAKAGGRNRVELASS